MSSGIIPQDGSVCCVCWGNIKPGENARDADGQLWDVHEGRCAYDAGINRPIGVGVPPVPAAPVQADTPKLEVQDP